MGRQTRPTISQADALRRPTHDHAKSGLAPAWGWNSPVAENRRCAHAPDVSTDFDSLSYLDDALYRRPIHGVTGRGNTHTLRRQAALVGSAYTLRWLSVVNDETRDRLVDVGDGVKVPGRLYGDLLGFTDTHGCPRMIPR